MLINSLVHDMSFRMKKVMTIQQWQKLAEMRLAEVLRQSKRISRLSRLGPKTSWSVNVEVVSGPVMKHLNSTYRGKDTSTDVLSFPAFGVFRETGILGEIVICLPKVKSQAKELKHSPQFELEILLIHGVLHLLGFDHEKGPAESKVMGRWEKRLLKATLPKISERKLSGLIDRAESGIDKK